MLVLSRPVSDIVRTSLTVLGYLQVRLDHTASMEQKNVVVKSPPAKEGIRDAWHSTRYGDTYHHEGGAFANDVLQIACKVLVRS